MSDFENKRAVLEREFNESASETTVTQLRALHESWARAILEVDAATPLVEAARGALTRGVFVTQAEAASQQLHVAVRWQWLRGALDHGPLLTELRVMQLARAWLLITNPLTIAEARALATEVSKDTRIDEPLRVEARALLAQLDGKRPTN